MHKIRLRAASAYILLGLPFVLSACDINTQSNLESLPPIDRIVVEKSQRTLSVYSNQERLRQYKISLGKSPIGHKEKEGDHKTPEGIYSISAKKPNHKFHKALAISYPNQKDKENATRKGHSPGGGVLLHGYEPHLSWVSQNHPLLDATRGCILLTNPEMEQIFNATPIGTTIEIKP